MPLDARDGTETCSCHFCWGSELRTTSAISRSCKKEVLVARRRLSKHRVRCAAVRRSKAQNLLWLTELLAPSPTVGVKARVLTYFRTRLPQGMAQREGSNRSPSDIFKLVIQFLCNSSDGVTVQALPQVIRWTFLTAFANL